MATTEVQEDLFECSVCLNYMLDRNPRSLSCLHTFCEDCLHQLIDNKEIRCPTCRKITELKNNDVEELVINFHLLKMKDIGNKPQSNTKANPKSKKNDSKSMCQICETKPPVYKCKDCPSLICESCKSGHNDMFEGHAVFDMCEIHHKSVTHLCKKCIIPLCMKCGVLDHKEHKAYFVDYNKGTKELKEEVKTWYLSMEEDIKKLDLHREQTNFTHEITLDIDKKLAAREEYHRVEIKEIEKLKDLVKTTTEEYERIQKACTETRDQCKVRAVSLKALTDDDIPGFCNRYSQLRPIAQEVSENAKKKLEIKYNPPPFLLTEYVKEPVAVDIKEMKQGGEKLIKEKMLLNIPKSDEINCREQIDFIGNDVVIIAGNNPQHVIRLNERGEVVARYYPERKGERVNGVSVYDNRIYLAQDNAITLISQKHGDDTIIYKPEVPKVNKILVADKSTLYISDFNNPGKVYKYNTESNQTEVVVKDLDGPYYMSVMYTLQGPRYIVTEYYKHRINIYDQRWNLGNTIEGGPGSGKGEFNSPHATAVTECGLLVADHNNLRINHYSLEGQFLGDVVTNKRNDLGCCPEGIAYRYPYLWVCRADHPLKRYQVKYQ